jgi:seryl-tRNA synthetase
VSASGKCLRTDSSEQAKENADDLMKEKDELTAQKKSLEESANEKHLALMKTAKRVGNYVHESVPVSDNEVS